MNMQKLMEEAQKAQRNLQEAQARLATLTVEGSAGGGMVNMTANGNGEVTHVTISPNLLNPEDAELLADLVKAAANDLQGKVRELQQKEMGSAFGGMGGLGGLGNLGNLGGLFGR